MCCPRGRDAAVPLMERGVSLSPLAASSAHIASELNAGNDGTMNAIYVYRYLRSRDDPCKFCNFCSFPFVFTVSVSCLSM